jgi:hypothetical protein
MLSDISSNDKSLLLKIMVFYSLLTYFIFPLIGFYMKKNKEGVTHGMLAGSIVSIFLWYKYGSNMLTMK